MIYRRLLYETLHIKYAAVGLLAYNDMLFENKVSHPSVLLVPIGCEAIFYVKI